MNAQELMTRKVRSISLMTPVRKIASLMIEHGISALPVVDGQKRVLGIVSERDLLRRAETGMERRRAWWTRLIDDPQDSARDYIKSRGAYARDVMSRPVISVSPTTSAVEIADLMEKWNIKRVPVVRAGKLIGIVSRRDLMHALTNASAGRKARVADSALRDRLRLQLRAEPWLSSALVNFVVDNGQVEITGVVSSKPEGDAIRVMAENLKGVRGVKSRTTVYSYHGA